MQTCSAPPFPAPPLLPHLRQQHDCRARISRPAAAELATIDSNFSPQIGGSKVLT
jgi:hypothetical protein